MDQGVRRFVSTFESYSIPIITSSSLLWRLSKTNHRFIGWFTSEVGGIQVFEEDMYFDNPLFLANTNTVLYARYVEIQKYKTPSITNITIHNITREITIRINVDTAFSVNPETIDLAINGQIISIPFSKFTQNSSTIYTLRVLRTDALHETINVISTSGIHFISVRIVGQEEVYLSSNFSLDYTFSNDAIIDGDITNVDTYDHFIVESINVNGQNVIRYVFYNNMSYTFNNQYDFSILSGNEFVEFKYSTGQTINKNVVATNSRVGDFRFTMRIGDGASQIYYGRVVENVNQFSPGVNYNNYLYESNANNNDKQFLKEEIDEYVVGTQNDFHLDIRAIHNSGNRIDISKLHLDYEFYLNDSYLPLEDIQLATYLTRNNYLIRFKESAIGQSFRIVVRPTYQANQHQNNDLTYRVTINSGFNVYTNNQLKVAFNNLSIKEINIHASFEAGLYDSQTLNGAPYNRYLHPWDQSPWTTGSVYIRNSNRTDNDKIVINGNYMTIDGSKLPFSTSESSEGTSIQQQAVGFEVINQRSGIFYYSVKDGKGHNLEIPKLGSDFVSRYGDPIINQENYNEINNNQFHLNNLIIVGNTHTPSANYGQSAADIESQEALISKNSGGYYGIFVRHGLASINNVIISQTVTGINSNAYGMNDEGLPTYTFINDVKVFDSWANSVYVHQGSGIVINRSQFGVSGGASIHVQDGRPNSGIGDVLVYIDKHTTFSNYVSGAEPWFRAYAMSPLALMMKSLLENGVNAFGQSVLKSINHPITGLPTEMMNFILISVPNPGAKTNNQSQLQQTGSQIDLYMEGESVDAHTMQNMASAYRNYSSFDYLSKNDIRIDNDGYLATPVGPFMSTQYFNTFEQQIRGFATLTNAQVVQIAGVAGFYGLDANQAYNVYLRKTQTNSSYQEAVTHVVGNNYQYANYIKILAKQASAFDGQAVIVVGITQE